MPPIKHPFPHGVPITVTFTNGPADTATPLERAELFASLSETNCTITNTTHSIATVRCSNLNHAGYLGVGMGAEVKIADVWVTVVATIHTASGMYIGANVYPEPIEERDAIERAVQYVMEGNEMSHEDVVTTYLFEVSHMVLGY